MAVELSDLLPERRFVSLGRGEAEVFPITLSQISVLLDTHGVKLEAIFGSNTSADAVKESFSSALKSAPQIADDLVAMALRVENAELVTRIPLDAKLDVLMATWSLSVADPKKLAAKLKDLAEKAKALRVEVGA